jgi:hypothetical protein
VKATTKASVYFRPVLCTLTAATASSPHVGCNSSAPSGPTTVTPLDQETASSTVLVPNFDHTTFYILGPADLTSGEISSAQAVTPIGGAGGYQVELTMTPGGAQSLDRVAAARFPFYQQDPANPPVGALEAVEVNGVVQSAPAMEASSFNGMVIVARLGSPMTADQANQLVQTWRSRSSLWLTTP